MPEIEIWKAITGFEGYYEVSTFGNVRSLDRYVSAGNGSRLIKGQRIKPLPAYKGYLGVHLRKRINKSCLFIHRLVLGAFAEPVEGMDICNHIDGNKQNNHIDNLEWTNKSGNAKHAYKIGAYDNYFNSKLK